MVIAIQQAVEIHRASVGGMPDCKERIMASAQRASLDETSVIPTVHIIHQSIKWRLKELQQRKVD